MNLKVMIVDDEPPARERLRTLIAEESGLELVAECESGREALDVLRERQTDLLFLDVQMPEMSGFDLLQKMPAPWPLVIFVTAFNEHAVAAFEVHAFDYLLKPFTAARFRAAIARTRETLSSQAQFDTTRRLQAWLDAQHNQPSRMMRLPMRDRDRTRFVNVSDIDWIEASGNYVLVHVGREKHILRESLMALEAQLPANAFCRINRSALVRLSAIVELVAVHRDEHMAVLHTGERLSLTCGVREISARMARASSR